MDKFDPEEFVNNLASTLTGHPYMPAAPLWDENAPEYGRLMEAAPALLRDLDRLVEMHDIPESEWEGEFDRLALTGRLMFARATLAYVLEGKVDFDG